MRATQADDPICPIIIPAAGQSKRMGSRDKLLEPVRGMPLIRLQCERALATGQRVFVTVPSETHARATAIADLPVEVISVPDHKDGLSASLRHGVASLPDVPRFMIALADLVALETSDLRKMIDLSNTDGDVLIWRGTDNAGKPGHPVIFDGQLRSAFAHLDGDKGAAPIIAAHRQKTKHIKLGPQALLDLDTPEDWENWRKQH
ncbi:nucleotidyltransferase family protein [Loktanella sp. S4079]|uniref:nucleotidyltransferase family protein n=1 Tax=Loktanella sp. S4079 TaxID=579483 RepID=UPI0005F9F35A|nr:nucleotidyltransferase family protein [Loktanella sp. S4079]